MTREQLQNIVDRKTGYLSAAYQTYYVRRSQGMNKNTLTTRRDMLELLLMRHVASANYKKRFDEAVQVPAYIGEGAFNFILSAAKL